MKIAVLVKQVPGSESPLSITNSNTWLDEEKVAYIMNESDNYALEEALLLKEDTQDCEVVVVSLGPERVKKIIREGFGDDLVNSYVKLKNQDWDTFNKHLSSWERETTLDC